MTGPSIEIDAVSKAFDTTVAVDQVSLRVSRGETLGLIGPNGAGKTTLLRIMSTLALPDQGDVRILGVPVATEPRTVRRKLGFMPAEFGNPPHMSIGEYLDYFGCLYEIRPRDRRLRVRDVCELTDLAGREQVMIRSLSTGNRQRLLLAKTLLHDPEVLILDEPASGLDPRARLELRATVRTLASLGKTIVISSHILPDIEEISDSIGILEAGRMVLYGNLTELRARQSTTQRVVRLRVLAEDRDRAVTCLKHLDGVHACEWQDPWLVIRNLRPCSNYLLAELLKHDVRILQFTEDEPSLEEIFMGSTAGRVT